MTIDEFFDVLPRDGWELCGNLIRRFGCDCCDCPLTAAAATKGWNPPNPREDRTRQIQSAGESLQLSLSTITAIASSADTGRFSHPAIRARLLDHCGLTEAVT